MLQRRYNIIITILCATAAAEGAKNNHVDFIDVAADKINNHAKSTRCLNPQHRVPEEIGL